VRDHGPGVPPEALEKLFQPFFRVADARDRKSGGTGIGLAIADRAIRLGGGTIRAENRPEGGLDVLITLPPASEKA
jgi:two-component system sensor histidine kinase CpxA